ncbi:MAG: flagellar basal-body rod protein FlgG [Candidatus Marinimicrobia bacterium]|nr:flagellar basal-body rod protein FlgG [Candidatus Neomarinimicrobiota bacterium]
MLRSLRTAALGMSAQQLHIDVISNNLANVNTNGYKKVKMEFQDLLYETLTLGSGEKSNGYEKPAEIQVGLGNRPVSTYRAFSQGEIEQTGNPLDIAINGRGFFQVQRPDGTIAYTRDGSFRINANGNIVNNSGYLLYPEIVIPENASSIKIDKNGVIYVLYEDQTEPEEIGQIELAMFMNPAGLKPIGENLFEETDASGVPVFGLPGEEGFGEVEQGYLEKSNVDVVQEMIDLIVAQRAYEINSRAVRTADEILRMTNALVR